LTGLNVRTAFTREAPTVGINAHTIFGKENPSEHAKKGNFAEESGDVTIVAVITSPRPSLARALAELQGLADLTASMSPGSLGVKVSPRFLICGGVTEETFT
jgi:hypothetical protein